jgi:hypothetical protein
MLNTNKVNNSIKLLKLNNQSIKKRILWIKKKHIKNKKIKFLFNLKNIYLFDSNYRFYCYVRLCIKRKHHWWRKIFYKKKYIYNLKFGLSEIFQKSWLSYINDFPVTKNNYLLYIRYFHTYKSLKFKSLNKINVYTKYIQ